LIKNSDYNKNFSIKKKYIDVYIFLYSKFYQLLITLVVNISFKVNLRYFYISMLYCKYS